MKDRINELLSKYEEFKVFHNKWYSFVIFILFCIVLYLGLIFIVNIFGNFWLFLESAPSEQIVALSTMLGLTIGGLITYFTTHFLTNRNRKIDILLKSKRTTFEPVYEEVRDLQKYLPEIGNLKYNFDRHLEYSTMSGTSTARIEAILSDARKYNLPNYFKIKLENLVTLTYEIEKQFDVVSVSFKEVFRKFFEENDIELLYEKTNNRREIDPLQILGASNLRHKVPFEPNHFKLSGARKIDIVMREELIKMYNDELENNSEYKKLFILDTRFRNQVFYVKNLFGKLIALITSKYERMWR